jgi:hypothetical protein
LRRRWRARIAFVVFDGLAWAALDTDGPRRLDDQVLRRLLVAQEPSRHFFCIAIRDDGQRVGEFNDHLAPR